MIELFFLDFFCLSEDDESGISDFPFGLGFSVFFNLGFTNTNSPTIKTTTTMDTIIQTTLLDPDPADRLPSSSMKHTLLSIIECVMEMILIEIFFKYHKQ